jgi:hypothetical protein
MLVPLLCFLPMYFIYIVIGLIIVLFSYSYSSTINLTKTKLNVNTTIILYLLIGIIGFWTILLQNNASAFSILLTMVLGLILIFLRFLIFKNTRTNLINQLGLLVIGVIIICSIVLWINCLKEQFSLSIFTGVFMFIVFFLSFLINILLNFFYRFHKNTTLNLFLNKIEMVIFIIVAILYSVWFCEWTHTNLLKTIIFSVILSLLANLLKNNLILTKKWQIVDISLIIIPFALSSIPLFIFSNL